MNFIIFIAKRFAISKNRTSVINILSIISGFVVITSTASLLIVLSGFAGLKEIGLESVNSFDPDLKLVASRGKTFKIMDSDKLALNKLENLDLYSQVVEERAFLSYKEKNRVAYIKGVDRFYTNINNIDYLLNLGDWDINNFRVVSAYYIAEDLGIEIYDSNDFLNIIIPKKGMRPLTSMSSRPYNQISVVVTGMYFVGSKEIDNKYVFIDIDIAKKLLDIKEDEVTSIEIKLKNPKEEKATRKALKVIFGDRVIVKNKVELNSALYKMLNTENLAIYLIFVLILIIAIFNLIGSLLVIIMDKKRDIKTLYNIGATIRELRRIFFLQGLFTTFISTSIGLLIGLGFTFLQANFGFMKITPTLAYPMKINVYDIFQVLLIILTIGGVSSKVVSLRISKNLLKGFR